MKKTFLLFTFLLVVLLGAQQALGQAFVTTWKTDNPGTSEDNEITIPTIGSGYSYSVDWGDESSDDGVAGNITHTYDSPGTYTVSITGSFPRIYFNNGGDKQKILTVEAWGNIEWTNMESAFFGCSNLNVTASDAPDLSAVSSMQNMFQQASSLTADLNHWNVSHVTNMVQAFAQATNFNGNITSWDVSNVTNLYGIFAYAESFNQPIGNWNVAKVTNMTSVFRNARAFTQDITNWNVGNVTNFSLMFDGHPTFNQNISSWNVSKASNMSYMFRNATAFNQPIGNWNVSKVTDMSYMFYNAQGFNQPLDNWQVDLVTNMESMFYNAIQFNQDIGKWNVANVTKMRSMFQSALAFNQDIGGWTVSKVTDMTGMFAGAEVFNADIGGWNVGNVNNTSVMFADADEFDQNLSDWNVSKVTAMDRMFLRAAAFNGDVTNWDVSKVTNMANMFDRATSFNQDLSDWNIELVTNMTQMFDQTSLSSNNYDNILTSWSNLSVQSDVKLGAAGVNFCHGESAKNDLFTNRNWDISDAGQQCRPFITTWETTSSNEQITIPTTGAGYNYDVDWGDGTVESDFTGDASHTYTDAGNHTISISGDFPRIYFSNDGDKEKILSIEQWGDIQWTSMEGAFNGCINLTIPATDAPNLTQVTSMAFMLIEAQSLNDNINHWNVSNVTDMRNMFNSATIFNQPLDHWDVSNVVDMSGMFSYTDEFNQDLNDWDVSSVENMSSMFRNAFSFNQNLSNWDVSSVTDMSLMFINALDFNGNISNWDVGQVGNMNAMFFNATDFNQDLGDWDVSSVFNMSDMLDQSGLSITNYDKILNGWSQLTLLSSVAFGADGLEYCLGSAGRDILTNAPNNWVITDGGENCVVNIPDANFLAALIALGIDEDESGGISFEEASVVNNLQLAGKGIEDLTGIEAFTGLITLTLSNNSVSDVDLSNNPDLENLNMLRNGLSEIDLSNNTSLKTVNLVGNNLTSIDITNNLGLTQLFLGENSITELDVTQHVDLINLGFQDNDLSGIDLSNNPDLKILYAYGNPNLSFIDLRNSHNESITDIRLSENPSLTCVSVDNPAYSKTNWTDIDDPSVFKFTCDGNDIVNIPDANFKAALLANTTINSTDDGEITYGEAEAYTGMIDVDQLLIADLTGIETFVNITSLDCGQNSLASINISNNTELKTLWIDNNDLTSVDISNLTKLSDFRCGNNAITTLELSNNTEITVLIVGGNELSEIDVSALTKLSTQFSCDSNNLTSLDVSNNPLLKRLFIQNNQITELNLSNNPSLNDVYLVNNQLTSLNMRSGGNTNVTSFNVTGNNNLECVSVDNASYSTANWTSIPEGLEFKLACDPDELVYIPDEAFKSSLTAGTSIDTNDDDEISYGEAEAYSSNLKLDNRGIEDLTGIEAFININKLEVQGNALSELSLENNTALTYLNVSDNDLTSFDPSKLTLLTTFQIARNEITTLDVSANTLLETLSVQQNGSLENVDLSALTGLKYLNMTGINSSSVDVSNNTQLLSLQMSGVEMESIDLSNNTLLQILSLSNNSLSSIDLSANTALYLLWLGLNEFTSLDLSELPAIKDLSLTGNMLTELNVANGNNTNFTRFELSDNPNLTCITVDDVAYSQANWTDIDETANFSLGCDNVAAEITGFTITDQIGTTEINSTASTISLEVPFGTDLTALAPTVVVSAGATVSPATGAAQNFTSSVVYTVTAENPTVTKQWTVAVLEENAAPADITLSETSIAENNTVGQAVGSLTSADANAVSSHTYTLVEGEGDTDNASFEVSGTSLLAKEVFDFESKASYSIRIKTDDGRSGTFEKVFTISVTNVNEVPVVAQTLADQAADEGFATTMLSYAGTFTDEDGDALIITASSGSEGVVTVEAISGDQLKITEVGVGSSVITVTADDGKGGSVSTSFTFTVNEIPNQAPIVANEFPGTFSEEEGFGTVLISYAGVFSDPDGDALTITVASSDEAVVTASVAEGSQLQLFEVGIGSSTITVSANDGRGGLVSDSFEITVAAAGTATGVGASLPGIVVFPNPATDFVKLTGLSHQATIQLVGSDGHMISDSHQDKGDVIVVDMQGLTRGIYILRVVSGDRSSSFRIIKE
jgi:surface protein